MEVDPQVVDANQEEQKRLNEKKERAKKIIGQVYNQLTKGCGKEFCTNKDCASNKVAWKDKKLSEKDALKLAIQFTKTFNTNPNTLKLCSAEIRPKTIQFEELSQLETASCDELESRFLEVFSCPFTLSFSFLKDREYYLQTEQHNIDFEAVERYYRVLESKCGEDVMVQFYLKACEEFYQKFVNETVSIEEPWIFRSFFIVMQNPSLFNPLCHGLVDAITMSSFVQAFNDYKAQRETVKLWISQFSTNRLLDHVQKIQTAMTIQIFNRSFTSENINNYIDALDVYNAANEMKPEGSRVKYTEFYNDGVNKEIELASHYEKWIRALDYCRENEIAYKKSLNFTLCNYPWLLDTSSKGEIIKYEAKAQMKKYGYQDLANMFIMGLISQNAQTTNELDYIYLRFPVSRENIIEDTLNNLISEDVNLKKQLRVSFKGEFGQDEGGVQKEFFQILVRNLFNPEYTMFTYFKESKFVWFNPITLESPLKFELIGSLMGLAIYNQVLLDIHFPTACYKKLLDIEPNLSDLKELIPTMGESLQYILD